MGHEDLKVKGDLKVEKDLKVGNDLKVKDDLDVEGHIECEHHLKVDGHLYFGQVKVTQLTSNTTAVTANGASGAVTLSGVIANATTASFVVNNNKVHAGSIVLVSLMYDGGATSTAANLSVYAHTIAENQFSIRVVNDGITSTPVAPVVSFLVC